MNVKRDDVGIHRGELLQTLHAVAREIDLELGDVGQHAAQ